MNSKPKLETLAQRIANPPNERGEQEVFIDPATIMLICSILSALFNAIRMFRSWKNDKASAQKIIDKCEDKQPAFVFFLRSIIRKCIGKISRKELTDKSVVIMENVARMTSEELLEVINEK